MTWLAVLLALLSACGNAVASVLQRKGASTEEPPPSSARFGWLRWLVGLIRRPVWLWGMAALVLSAVSQVAALAVGPLSVVQPVMTTELLFTLAVGSVVFRRPAGARTWRAFLMMAVGLGVFLGLADPTKGSTVVPGDRWLVLLGPTVLVVAALVALSLRLPSAPRATALGSATAIGFSFTAALLKDAIGRADVGLTVLLTSWQFYTAMAVGLFSFLMLQATLRAGSLVASQPALTLGDALLSMILGAVLFDETIALGWRIVPEAAALLLLVMGSIRVARSPLVAGPRAEQQW